MADQAEIEAAKQLPIYSDTLKLHADPNWRIDNLYHIVSESGSEIAFQRNEAQKAYSRARHSRDLIVKARKLGFSTFIALKILDTCIFRKNIRAGIVDVTLDDAKKKLEMIAFAFDRMPGGWRETVPTVRRNTEQMQFSNGSEISVGTSYRGGTPQILHVSEYGRISVDTPDRAKDIKTGSIQAVPINGWCVLESTAHGTAGEYYDLVKAAERDAAEGRPLNPLSWKSHFYGWWIKRENRVPNNLIVVDPELRDYFKKVAPILLARHGVKLDADQMAWYVQKHRELGPDDMFEEYPTIVEETFFKSILGAYWGKEIAKARAEKRIGFPVPHDPTRRVNTMWDIGEDCTAIIFYQDDGVRQRYIDYWEEEGGSLQSAAGALEEKRRERGFIYGKHIGPHDLDHRDWAHESLTRKQTALGLGIKFEVVPQVQVKADSIEAGRRRLATAYICSEFCGLLVERLENYRKKWNKALQVFSPDPVHDMASHGSDAWQQGAMYKDDGKDGAPPTRGRGRDREGKRTSPWSS